MKEKIYILFLGVMLAIGLLLAGFGSGWVLRGKQMPPTTDTIVKVKIDTVTLVEPRVDSLIRYVDRLYPFAVHDTTLVVRHTTDSVFISLPYQYKYYSIKDTLDIWYSGVDPRIDSARIYKTHTTEIIRQPYEVAKMPRLTAEIGVGGFYYDNCINPYLKGELRCNAKKTTFGVYGAVDHQGRWGVGASVSYRVNLLK